MVVNSLGFNITRTLLILMATTTLIASGQEAPEPVFRAGAATSNITPPLGISISGGMSDRIATNVHDELHARCLALDDGQSQLVFALVDSCMVPRDVFDAAKQAIADATGVPVASQLMAATHTHSAACATPVFQSDPAQAYKDFLVVRIADGVRRALNNLEPARIARGSGNLPDEVFNRRWHMKEGTVPVNPFGGIDQVKMNPSRGSEDLLEPAGPIDPEISFLAVESIGGRPIALLANYSLHYVGGTAGPEISADYFGIFANRIKQLLDADHQDPPFVGIMSNGTSGDINNINFRIPGEAQEAYKQMTIVANKAAAEVYSAYQTLEWRDDVTLDSARTEISLGVRLPSAEDVIRAQQIVDAAAGPTMGSMEEVYARETLLLNDYPAQVELVLQAHRIGDWAVAAIPCEVFVQLGLNLKANSPIRPLFTIELANGYNGYLPTAEQHPLGGYETWRARSSYLEVDAATKIEAAVMELLGQLNAQPAGAEIARVD